MGHLAASKSIKKQSAILIFQAGFGMTTSGARNRLKNRYKKNNWGGFKRFYKIAGKTAKKKLLICCRAVFADHFPPGFAVVAQF